VVASAAVTYIEGYLWDQPQAKDAIRRAAEIAHDADQRVALTLSDPFCVDRHRDEFRDLIDGHIDILFGNADEITMLYEVDTFDQALHHVRGHCEIAALTRGKHGSVIVHGDDVHVIDAHPTNVVDTTGAGDQYAAGFLFGFTHGHDLAVAGQLASLAAAEVISHLGARPEKSLAELAAPLLGD
jgi:sugar/nucleoside kinase (ribokinase family)